jgi:hypothetical protein
LAHKPANTRVTGRSHQYVRTADSGQTISYHFCPDCGATVHYQLQQVPDLIAIPLGAFADPQFPPPRFSFYESRQHEWVKLDGPLEHED